MFLKLDGVQGRMSTRTKHKDEIELISSVVGLGPTGPRIAIGTGGQAKQVARPGISLTKFVDKASVDIVEDVLVTASTSKRQFYVPQGRRAAQVEYLKIDLEGHHGQACSARRARG